MTFSSGTAGRAMTQAVITGHPQPIPDYSRRPVRVGFVVSSVALGQVFRRVLWFNSASIMQLFPHTHSSLTYAM